MSNHDLEERIRYYEMNMKKSKDEIVALQNDLKEYEKALEKLKAIQAFYDKESK